MADEPEITTSAYSFTRRTLLVASVSAAAPASFGGVAPLDTSRIEAADAAMSMWTQWRAAQDAADVLCQKQQSLETQLMQLIRESCSIDNTDCAEADRAAQEEDERARWAAADLAVGYSEEKKEEERAAKELADALAATPASSVEGVAAKPHAVLREGEWCENCIEFPWPQGRSALLDLIRIGRLDSFPEF